MTSNPAPLDIPRVQLANHDGMCRVSAMVEGEDVWFESGVPLRPSAEAFLSALLIPAMTAGQSLRTDDTVCSVWAEHAREAREIARRYWGFAGGEVEGPVASVNADATATGVFFTGGVDSFHALLTNLDTVSALIFVQGFDIPLTDEPRLEATARMLDRVADACNLRVLTVRTNLRQHPVFRRAHWGNHTHGAALGAVAQLLAPHVGHVLVASSDVPPPHGSTVELDRCWSSASVSVATAGPGVSRLDKVAAIADHPLVHRELRVCWENRSAELNCGECEKCVRTQAQFAAAGALDRLTCFGTIDLPARIRGLWSIPHHLGGQWADAQRALGPTPAGRAVRGLRYRTWRHRLGDAIVGRLRGS
ncbi:MAG TPA: hypothetical protein VFK36_02340 [Gemmatimonadales bacterium]|nr:hypothetical protein [Gemmatimonadales bacterium]